MHHRFSLSAAKIRLGLAILSTLTVDQALCQAAPEPAAKARQAETAVTLDSPEPTAALLQAASRITTTLSEESPSARLSNILKVKNAERRRELLAAFGAEMGDTSPERGWQMVLTELQTIPDRQSFGVPLLRRWAEDHPHAALEACKQIPEGERRALAYSAALAGWASVDPQAAAAWSLENLSGIYRRTAIARIGKVWACTEPRKAAEWALTYASEVDQVFSLSEVMDSWADTFSRDAVDWSASLPAGKLRDLTLSKAIFKWADYFPQTASEWLVGHPDDLWLLPRVAARWGQQDPAAASAWLDKNVSESSAQECRQAMVMEWANYNPRVAFEWADKALKGISREATFSAIFGQWASEYPQEARLSALKLADETERHSSLESIFITWGTQDLEAFSAWLKQQKPGIEKDIGIEQLASILITSNPAAALGEVLTMQNPSHLQRVLILLYQDWKRNDPQAAEAWLKLHSKAVKLMTP